MLKKYGRKKLLARCTEVRCVGKQVGAVQPCSTGEPWGGLGCPAGAPRDEIKKCLLMTETLEDKHRTIEAGKDL